MTSSPTHPYHSVPRRPSWEALPQLSIFPRGSPLASYCWWIPYLWMAGPGKHVWVWQMRRGWWERVKNKNESQKNKRELGYEQNGEGEKRGKKHRREREKWEAHSGEDKVLPFFLLFLTGQLRFFPLLSLLFFFWHRQSRLDHPSETTWCVALPSYPLFLHVCTLWPSPSLASCQVTLATPPHLNVRGNILPIFIISLFAADAVLFINICVCCVCIFLNSPCIPFSRQEH